jgi:Tfp pilus assembly protein PilF
MHTVLWLLLSLSLAGCATNPTPVTTVLTAPSGTKAEVASQLERGNALFASRDWAGAEQAFRQTIKADASLAEAHYNLALTLERQGKQTEAKKHYVEAANLAPGNKVIWDSPPFHDRTGGFGHDVERPSYQDPSHKMY